MVERAAVELCATDELNPYLVGGTNTLEERCKGAKTVTSEATEGCKGGADDKTEAEEHRKSSFVHQMWLEPVNRNTLQRRRVIKRG